MGDCALIIISGLILTGTYLEERVMIRTVLTFKKKLKLKKLVTGATSPLKHKKRVTIEYFLDAHSNPTSSHQVAKSNHVLRKVENESVCVRRRRRSLSRTPISLWLQKVLNLGVIHSVRRPILAVA